MAKRKRSKAARKRRALTPAAGLSELARDVRIEDSTRVGMDRFFRGQLANVREEALVDDAARAEAVVNRSYGEWSGEMAVPMPDEPDPRQAFLDQIRPSIERLTEAVGRGPTNDAELDQMARVLLEHSDGPERFVDLLVNDESLGVLVERYLGEAKASEFDYARARMEVGKNGEMTFALLREAMAAAERQSVAATEEIKAGEARLAALEGQLADLERGIAEKIDPRSCVRSELAALRVLGALPIDD